MNIFDVRKCSTYFPLPSSAHCHHFTMIFLLYLSKLLFHKHKSKSNAWIILFIFTFQRERSIIVKSRERRDHCFGCRDANRFRSSNCDYRSIRWLDWQTENDRAYEASEILTCTASERLASLDDRRYNGWVIFSFRFALTFLRNLSNYMMIHALSV